jgi:hypothetical protein
MSGTLKIRIHDEDNPINIAALLIRLFPDEGTEIISPELTARLTDQIN